MSNDLISREYIKAFICEYEKFNGKETEIVKAIPIQAIDNAPTVDITEEQAIDKLHETGWMQKHDKEMTARPTGEWIETAKEYYEAVNERGGGVDEHTPVEKWECVEDDNYAGGGYWECPSCKTRFSFRGFNMLNDMPYCPRCGNRVKTELEAENEQVR